MADTFDLDAIRSELCKCAESEELTEPPNDNMIEGMCRYALFTDVDTPAEREKLISGMDYHIGVRYHMWGEKETGICLYAWGLEHK